MRDRWFKFSYFASNEDYADDVMIGVLDASCIPGFLRKLLGPVLSAEGCWTLFLEFTGVGPAPTAEVHDACHRRRTALENQPRQGVRVFL